MREIILEKRYPHSREEDITDAFMRGYEIGKEQEHRWWSAFCANCKTESNSEKPNNCEHITEDGVTCAKYPACDDCLDNPLNKVKGSERLLKGKDEPQTERSE